MNPPTITEQDLHAWADGRLDAARRAQVEAWLAQHPAQQARVAAWRAQGAQLHRAFDVVLDEPVPARLTPPAPRAPLRAAALLAWLALGVVIGYAVRGALAPPESAPAPLARQAAIAHAVYAPEQRHPVEVGADQEAHLVAWLSKRLGAPLRVPQLGAAGYALVGGRLLPGESGPVAQFMYQRDNGQRLTLYLRRAAPDAGQSAFRHAQEGAIGVFYWIDDGWGYALSGELAREQLLDVASRVYAQLNPEERR